MCKALIFQRKTTHMKNLYLFLLLSLALTACRFNFDPDFSGPAQPCKGLTTDFSFQFTDYYSRLPITGVRAKVTQEVSYCAWCPLPDTILTVITNLQGKLSGTVRHDSSNFLFNNIYLTMPDSYLPVRPFPLAKGCDNVRVFNLKPKSKLGIWIKNTTDDAVLLNQISIAQQLQLPANTKKDLNDPAQQAFESTQYVAESLPGHSNWKLYWFDALPEEIIEIKLTSANRDILTERFTTARDSVFFYKIRIR
jgi:hypothetical protein